jgi:hypothetical protein
MPVKNWITISNAAIPPRPKVLLKAIASSFIVDGCRCRKIFVIPRGFLLAV